MNETKINNKKKNVILKSAAATHTALRHTLVQLIAVDEYTI